MINEPVEGGLGEGAADLLAQMGGAGGFGGDDAGGEGEGAAQPGVVAPCMPSLLLCCYGRPLGSGPISAKHGNLDSAKVGQSLVTVAM